MRDPAAGSPRPFAALSVLVVDDDELVRTVMQRVLAQIGVGHVHVAESAEAALDAAARLVPAIDVVIADLDMPDVDGLEFLRRWSQQRPGASVLISSGKARSILRSVEVMAREYGLLVLGVLPKPATIAALREALGRHPAAVSDPVRAPSGVVTSDEVARAIDRREFALFYQPKIALATGRVCGAEALVRWRHPVLGLLSPALFLDLAEQMGLMPRLTIDLLEEAITEAKGWQAAGLGLSISVNVSQSSLVDTTFSASVLDACARHGVSPERLVVEITETTAMTDVAHSLETLARLRMHGVGLAIDDFGTGHSSFRQLSRVPCTELKIDRGFVTGASTQPLLRTIVESNVRMARDLGLTCTGEGIESRDDWDLLRDLGCDAGQGFFIAGPMDRKQLPGWIRAWDETSAASSPRKWNRA